MLKVRLAAACIAVVLLTGADRTATNPWFGTWKLRVSQPSEAPETLIYSDAGRGSMRMISLESNSEMITRFDGRPASNIREHGVSTYSLSIRATSPTSYTWVVVRPGKPNVLGRNVLAADGRSFTEVSWLETQPTRTVIIHYDRQ